MAFLISLAANIAGISGAALYVPFFVLVFPFFAVPLTALQSVKLGLVLESFGLTSAALAFMAFGLEDKKLAFYSVLGALPLVIAGAVFSLYIPESVILSVVAAALVSGTFMKMYAKPVKQAHAHEHQKEHVDLTVTHGEDRHIRSRDHRVYKYSLTPRGYKKRFIGLGLGGFFQGAAGFGIGEMAIIGMTITKIPVRVAIGTSHLIVASTAIIATIIHIFQDWGVATTVPWNVTFMAVPAAVIAGQLSPYIDSKLPPRQLQHIISALFFGVAVALLLLALQFLYSVEL